jgi:hypothetical protein
MTGKKLHIVSISFRSKLDLRESRERMMFSCLNGCFKESVTFSTRGAGFGGGTRSKVLCLVLPGDMLLMVIMEGVLRSVSGFSETSF